MRQTVVFRLEGALAAAVAVEWTAAPAPVDSGAGWQACLRLESGDWRFTSHAAGAGLEWREPGLFAGIALRYRLSPAGPWSPISAGRKEIVLVAADPGPVAPAAADWSAPVPLDLGSGRFTGRVTLALPAAAVEWTAEGVGNWQPCEPLGAGDWRLASYGLGGAHLLARGGRLEGIALRWRATAGGPWSPASTERRTLEIPAEAPDGPWLPPVLLLAPALAGSGRIGEEVAAAPGTWGGVPAPALALQWCRDGAPIPGATGARYLPGPEDDLAGLSCRVTATSAAGSAMAETAALAVTYRPPEAVGTILEEIFDEGSGTQTVDARPFFRGEGLGFTVTGAGATVDPAGLVVIPTDAPLSDTVSVTARNSGGAASQSFAVTVEAAVEILDPPPALAAGDWDVYWAVDPTQDGVRATWHFAVRSGPALAATRLFWRGQATADGAVPGAGFHACIPHPSRENHWIARADLGVVREWLWVNSTNPAYAIVGQPRSHLAIYSCDDLAVAAGDALFSPVSNVVEKVVKLEGAPSGVLPSRTATRRMPIVFPSEVGVAGYVPADGMQQWHAMASCRDHPDVIYGMQDSGALWLSRDHGRSWYLPARSGLNSYQGLGVAVDPVDPLRVLCNMGGSFLSNKPHQGLYASIDGGMTFGPRIRAGVTDSRRGTHAAMACDPGSIGPARAEKWLAIVDGRFEGGEATNIPIMVSTDGWESWTERGIWNQESFGTSAWAVGDPAREGCFLVACGKGLVRVTGAFSGTLAFTLLSGSNGLPAGGIAGKPYVSADGRTIIVGPGSGIYRSTNGGASWSRVGTEQGYAKLEVNPYDPSHMILIYSEQNSQQQPKYSTNGGASFTATRAANVETRPGMSYTPRMMYNFAHVAFHATAGHAFLCGRQTSLPAAANHYRTEDHGASWSLSMEGFSGGNFSNRGAGPFMFSPTDRKRFALGLQDIGVWLTNDGGRSFSESSFTNALTGEAKRSTFGVAVHPEAARRTLFGAVSGQNSPYVLVRSLDDGATWDVPLGSTRSDGSVILFDRDDPAHVFWGRHRSSSHGAGGWSEMPALPADFAVFGCTLTAPGGQALFAIDLGGDVKRVRRSTDRGATWPEVLAMPFNNKVTGSKWGPFRAHPSDRDILFTKGPNGHTIRRWSLDAGSASARPFVDLNIFGPGGRPSGFSTTIEAAALAIDPRFPDVMYVLTGFAGAPRLFRTTDGGRTAWEPLPEMFPLCCNANAIEVSPVTGDVIMGGSNGTFIAPPPYAQPDTLFGMQPERSYLQTTAW